MKPHRVFISAILPEKEKQKLSQYQDKFLFDSCFNITHKKDLHLTLIFIGEIFDQQLTQLCQSVSKVCETQGAFDITLTEIEYGPNPFEPRLVWIQGPKNNLLDKLKSDLEKELAERGIPFSYTHKKFQPHITLARIKKDFVKETLSSEKQISNNLKILFTFNHLAIMESTLDKTGTSYDILQSYYLK